MNQAVPGCALRFWRNRDDGKLLSRWGRGGLERQAQGRTCAPKSRTGRAPPPPPPPPPRPAGAAPSSPGGRGVGEKTLPGARTYQALKRTGLPPPSAGGREPLSLCPPKLVAAPA